MTQRKLRILPLPAGIHVCLILSAVMAVLPGTAAVAEAARGTRAQRQEETHVPAAPIESVEALANPERGFRFEVMFNAKTLGNPWNDRVPAREATEFIANLEKRFDAAQDKLTVTQLYIYLNDYVGTDISQQALDAMQVLFDQLEAKGCKAVLRFAYDYSPGATKVSFADIFRHQEQLKPLIMRNIGLIHVWQAGFVGAWGEWHSTPLRNDWKGLGQVVNNVLAILPDDRQTQLRIPDYKRQAHLAPEHYCRVGLHNDYFTAGEHQRARGNDYVPGDPSYQQATEESPWLLVDGEMPYEGANDPWCQNAEINALRSLGCLRDHHYSTFSITHNYSITMAGWRNRPVTARLLAEHSILFEPEYFKNSEGKEVSRSVFQFIRDHLGYRLYLDRTQTRITVKDGTLSYQVALRNVGFSALHNPRPVYLVLVDTDGRVAFRERLAVKPSAWQPYDPKKKDYQVLTHRITGVVTPTARGLLRAGLWLPDPTERLALDPRYAIRFANKDLVFLETDGGRYGINILGAIIL